MSDPQDGGRGNEVQNDSKKDSQKNGSSGRTATEVNAGIRDPRQKRKNMKRMKRDDGGREVTDPVTHLPVVIYDATDERLQKVPENEPSYGSQPWTSTAAQKSETQLDLESRQNPC